MERNDNKFMKYFTIFLIIVFVLGTIGVGLISVMGSSQGS